MKTCKTEQEYIDAIASAVQKACMRYGYLPSVLVAQSCLENGYGIPDYWDNPQIEVLLKYNNMVGIKSELLSSSWSDKTVWPGESLTKQTPEEYGGKMVTITDKFRKYDNIEQSFADYLLFMKYASNYGKDGKPKYGDEVLSIKDPEKLIKTVSSRGYATGSTYPTSVMRIVNKHNLTKYDDLSNVTPTKYTPGYRENKATTDTDTDTETDAIKIIDRTAYNTPPRWGNTREALVFHFLGVAGADNPDLYDGGYGGQWYVSRKGEIYHSVKEGGTVWAVGSGGWGLKTDVWKNANTESVEMGCENDNGSDDIYDKKWWFHMATQEAAVKLARYWLESRGYGVSESSVNKRILIHNSITNKPCPAPWLHCAGYSSSREKGHKNWSFEEFKRKIWEGYKGNGGSTAKGYLSKGDSGEDVKTMQTMLNACGYNCGVADGDFGDNTDKALRAFQSASGLKVDGMYGQASKEALEAKHKAREAAEAKADWKLVKGDTGYAVKKMQEILIALGYPCGSSGADGSFGINTLVALNKFKSAANLDADGMCDRKTKAALDAAYAKLPKDDQFFLKKVKEIADIARKAGWKYGNSTSVIPCSDGKISCDRLIARALWDLGYTDQPKGGITCGHVEKYLPKFGFTKVIDRSKIKPGAVIAVKKKTQSFINHVFVVESYNKDTDMCIKYDTGSDERIKTVQPFKNVKLVEWSDREFVAAWNPPTKKSDFRPVGTATASKDGAVVKNGPGSKYDTIVTLSKGNRFEVDGKTSGRWVYINVNDVRGWLHSDYVRLDV